MLIISEVGVIARTATDTAILANAITDGKCHPPSHLTLSVSDSKLNLPPGFPHWHTQDAILCPSRTTRP
ncbi:hypothetical protein DSO57_1038553 [Entomophthora muscae]|uniref:Uncharacterized protein n=1 Tax=Entomophthora muscae TaxID=34485 RepID=A0ACC2T9X9_9FUNG|nr:hypothetical protein DSO57_1038553 [Entomophthora muscae]